MTKILEQISKLSIEERIVLVERIWDNIADSSKAQQMQVSPELEAELQRRYQLLEAGKTNLHSWEAIEAALLAQYPV